MCIGAHRHIFSQTLVKKFLSLPCAEKQWVLLHPFIAKNVYKLSEHAIFEAKRLINDTTLDGDLNGGQLDAFRHAFWMALITQKYGPRKAFSLGRAHEKGNYQYFKKNKQEDGTLPDFESSQMDYLNNDVGIEIGKMFSNISHDSLKIYIIYKIKEGKLYVLKKSEHGIFITCDGDYVCDSCKIWVKNKCIVPSNYKK